MLDSNTKTGIDQESPPAHDDGLATDGIAVKAIANSGAEKTKSAAAEIVVLQPAAKSDPVGDAIKKCKAVAKGESVFKAANAHIFDGLTAAYSMFLLIKDDKVEHQRVINEMMAEGNRERTPSLNKPAYNATVLACHPDNPEGWSLCSDWANVVNLADIERISSSDFPAWVKDKTIRDSKRKVRAAKQASRPLMTPFTEGDFPALAYVFNRCDDQRMRQSMKEALTLLNQQAGEALATMKVDVA